MWTNLLHFFLCPAKFGRVGIAFLMTGDPLPSSSTQKLSQNKHLVTGDHPTTHKKISEEKKVTGDPSPQPPTKKYHKIIGDWSSLKIGLVRLNLGNRN